MKKIILLLLAMSLFGPAQSMIYSIRYNWNRERYRQEVDDRKEREIREEVSELIERLPEADINKVMPNGRTPLYNAIYVDSEYHSNHTQVSTLLSLGADLRIRCGIWGHTPLHIAAECSGRWVMGKLLDCAIARDQIGELLDAKNDLGDTPLHHAIRSKRAAYIPLLIDRGSNVHQKSGTNKTSLELLFFDVDWTPIESEIPSLIFLWLARGGVSISQEVIAYINSKPNDSGKARMLQLCKKNLHNILRERNDNTKTFLACLKQQKQPSLYLEKVPAEVLGEVRQYFSYEKKPEQQGRNLSTPERLRLME